MKKNLLFIFAFVTAAAAQAQVAQNFDVPDVCSGQLPCWYQDGIANGTNDRTAVPPGTLSLCNPTFSVFDLNTADPISGTGSIHRGEHITVYASGATSGSGVGSTLDLYANASAADGDTVSFLLRVNATAFRNVSSMIRLSLICGDFVYQYNYTAADSNVVQTFSQVITGSNGGGVIQFKLVDNIYTSGVDDSLIYDLDIDNFYTSGPMDSLNACNAIVPLPLELLSFSGSVDHCLNRLQWKTGNEKNVDRFVIERSTDGKAFAAIAALAAGQGDSYTFEDRAAAANTCYRLKMVDKDGSFTYSNIIRIQGCLDEGITVAVYPNPVGDRLHISGTHTGDQIRIINAGGQAVFSVIAAQAAESIPTGDMPQGLYFITVLEKVSGKRTTLKFIKE